MARVTDDQLNKSEEERPPTHTTNKGELNMCNTLATGTMQAEACEQLQERVTILQQELKTQQERQGIL